ncbi:ABC transporter, ATP-binding domain protein [Bacteriovorax sp. BSW11_IV]|uniref:ATP-binding cassette domain-containing protein n=1 Tax=Bacteriovorax sp. BSW11_IV TaxID=1353529 RepID=UPI00038A38E5|nr:ATP-binding cassette domain-containing protein [Bacteriovorax sp. BSW11_IV]EQC44965.1 ABC transporter, ATP-binding domain protein [Bacteriovorax sp. BSW11_IV]
MTYFLKIDNVQRGTKTLLENVNLEFGRNERIALIGANGTGKSTLLNILFGEREGIDCSNLQTNLPDSRYYHKQELTNDKDIQFLFFPKNTEVGALYHAIYEGHAIVDDYSRYEELGGTILEEKFWRLLENLKYEPTRPLSTLSGGELMRLYLKRCEFHESEVVLLDEPSNHLDLEGKKMLSQFIENYRGTIICISHDVEFIDGLFSKLWVIENYKISSFSGNATAFFEYKKLERKKLIHKKELLRDEIKKLDHALETKKRLQDKRDHFKESRSIAKNGRICKRDEGSASGSFRPNSIRAQMNRLKNRISNTSDELSSLKTQKILNPKLQAVSLQKGGRLLLHGKKIMSFPTQVHPIEEISLERGQKLWIKGANGSGKSTLVQCLIGEGEIYSGEVKSVDNLKIVKATQLIQNDESLLNEFFDLDKESFTQVVTLFCSWGGDYESLVKNKALSFGQRVKLWLAFLSVAQFDILILDEPENHLDIVGRQGLCSFLSQYQGSLVLITHDEVVGKASNATEFAL